MLKSTSYLGIYALFFTAVSCTSTNEKAIKTSTIETENWQHQIIKDRYIVTLKNEAVIQHAELFKNSSHKAIVMDFAAIIAIDAGAKLGPNDPIYSNAINGFTITATKQQINILEADKRINAIESDVAIILSKGGQKNSDNRNIQPEQIKPSNITRVGGSKTISDKKAWIIDTGIDLDHPDLNVNNKLSVAFLYNVKGKPNPNDAHGHGTHVAGIVGAVDNTIGSVGVAQGCELVAVRVLDANGNGLLSDIIAGIDYVAKNAKAGDVANLSLGMSASNALDNAIANAASNGIYITLAAGNSTNDVANYSPARLNATNVYTISAMDNNDYWAYFSNYGSSVDYCEPGVAIFSTWLNGDYNTLTGTSMAAPHLAGILLVTGGKPSKSGSVINDPDGQPDPIGHL